MKPIKPALHALLLLAGTVLAAGCGSPAGQGTASMTTLKPFPTDVTAQDWRQLSQLRIAFGHQSVGSNVVAGIETLAKENGAAVAISETRAPFDAPGLHHFKIGRNGEPETKLKDFEAAIAGGLGQSADIALMKFCYIDFAPENDPRQMADSYIAELDELSARYPAVTFVPVTAPLTTVQTGLKAWIKQAVGKAPAGYEANARRQTFNGILRQHYAGDPRLFDLAAVESGFGANSIGHGGKHFDVLNPALTDDGGHLNPAGRRLAGGALAHHLATLRGPAGKQ